LSFSSFLVSICEEEKGDGSYHHLHQWFCYKEGDDNKSSPFFSLCLRKKQWHIIAIVFFYGYLFA
jgi:hypothetical protein